MKWIKVTDHINDVPIYIPVAQIGAVREHVIYNAGQKKNTGTGQVKVLVQGTWIHLKENPFYVLSLIRDATEL